jgi:DNA adenine methylase
VEKYKVVSPLRYPGGKSKAIKEIVPMVCDFEEYREPFVGGGSVFIYLKQKFPEKKFWINDINEGVYCFWKTTKENNEKFISEIRNIKSNYSDGKSLYVDLMSGSHNTEMEKAIRFFILNRITFSGTAESGGFSKKSFEQRFTDSSIDRISLLENVLQEVKITNIDYSDVMVSDGSCVFLFLDPPYYSTKKSKLYGKKGNLHTDFDHNRLLQSVKGCNHNWLITYDDCDEIKKYYDFANIKSWELQYGMNNVNSEKAKKGKELFINNYKI